MSCKRKFHDRDNDKSVHSPVVHDEKQIDFSDKGHDLKLENTEIPLS